MEFKYIDPSDLKMLREAACIAQVGMNDSDFRQGHAYIRVLANLIASIDEHRPLGPDGKHGHRHTARCGCEDIPQRNMVTGEPIPREHFVRYDA